MRNLVFICLLVGCDGHQVLSNGEDGELTAEVRGNVGVRELSTLPIGIPAQVTISRWEQTDDEQGRRTYFVPWTNQLPVVRFLPPELVTVEHLVLDPDGEFLEFSLTAVELGVGTLSVNGDYHCDSWSLSLVP